MLGVLELKWHRKNVPQSTGGFSLVLSVIDVVNINPSSAKRLCSCEAELIRTANVPFVF